MFATAGAATRRASGRSNRGRGLQVRHVLAPDHLVAVEVEQLAIEPAVEHAHLKGAVDYRTVDFSRGPVLLMMGNEQQGLPESLAASCDRLLRIPQAGRADSLNLAVATGIMLFEIRRGALKLEPIVDQQ